MKLLSFKYFMFHLLCYDYCNQGLVMQFAQIFLEIFKYYFIQNNLIKTMKKAFLKKKKKNNFLLKF